MFRTLLGLALSLCLLAESLPAQPPKGKDAQKKEAPKEKPKDAPKAKTAVGKEFTGQFKTKDESKKTLTLSVDGKDKTFKVTSATKFVGPRGGESDDKLKDDRLDKGYKITVVSDPKDEEVAAEVRLPFRNERDGGDKKKPDDKKK
jgi:hypothetical protein